MIDVELIQAESPLTFQEEQESEVVQVSGFAVHTGTFNDITIEVEELYKSVESLIGKPLLANHRNNTMSVIGKVTDAKIGVDPNNGKHGIAYTADIDAEEKDLIRKMKLGFLDSTSVGFRCDHICSICGSDIWKCSHWFDDDGFQVLAKNIQFHELSIVAIPADADASVKVNLSAEDKKNFEELKLKKEARRTNMSELQSKYDEVVDAFNQFKLEKADEIQQLNDEFTATKTQLESEKADKVEENLKLKSEIDALKQEKEGLEAKVQEFDAKFKEIETQRLSALKEEVMELSEKVNAGLTEEEINGFEESTLQRYAQMFAHQAESMVKTIPTPAKGGEEQYTVEIDEDAPQTHQFMSKVREARGF